MAFLFLYILLIGVIAQVPEICTNSDRLCVENREIYLNRPFNIYWPTNQLPSGTPPSTLVLSLYAGDLSAFPPNHCSIPNSLGTFPLSSAVYEGNMGISNVTIPSSDLLVSTISQSNRFFLQIRHLANLFCSVGPYIVTQNFNHISLKIPIEPSSTTTVVVDPLLPTPQAIPTSVAKSSETKGIALWLLAIIVLVSLMVLLMLVYTIYWIATRRRVSTGELASSDSPRPEKHQKDIEHQVDHPNPLGSQINHSTTSLPNPAFFDLTDNSSTVLSTSSEPPKRFISSLSHEDALAMADAFKVALKNPPDEWEEKD